MDAFSTVNTVITTSAYGMGVGFVMHVIDSYMPAKTTGQGSAQNVVTDLATTLLQAGLNMYVLGFLFDFRQRLGAGGSVPAEVTVPVFAAILTASQPQFQRKIVSIHRRLIDSWAQGFKIGYPGSTISTSQTTAKSNIQVTERNQNAGTDGAAAQLILMS